MTEKADNRGSGKVLHELFKEVFALHAALSGVMDRVHERSGLTTPQRKIARLLNRSSAATVPEVAAALNVSRQFVQLVCNQLLAGGLIEYKENPRHRRSKLAELTAAGRRAFEEAQRGENEIIESVLPGISPESAEAALGTLAQIRLALERH